MHTEAYAVIANCFCVRTVSHTRGNPGQTPSVTGTPRRVSMLGQIVDRKCVGGIWCASARARGINFQACSFNHSDISPFRISYLRSRNGQECANCVRPPNVSLGHLRAFSIINLRPRSGVSKQHRTLVLRVSGRPFLHACYFSSDTNTILRQSAENAGWPCTLPGRSAVRRLPIRAVASRMNAPLPRE